MFACISLTALSSDLLYYLTKYAQGRFLQIDVFQATELDHIYHTESIYVNCHVSILTCVILVWLCYLLDINYASGCDLHSSNVNYHPAQWECSTLLILLPAATNNAKGHPSQWLWFCSGPINPRYKHQSRAIANSDMNSALTFPSLRKYQRCMISVSEGNCAKANSISNYLWKLINAACYISTYSVSLSTCHSSFCVWIEQHDIVLLKFNYGASCQVLNRQMTTWQWQPYDCESCILTTAPSQLDLSEYTCDLFYIIILYRFVIHIVKFFV